MAEYAFFFPPQPDNENAVKELKISYFTDHDQLQQHSSFLALQAASTDQDSLACTHTVLSSSHDHPPVSSHAACSSDSFEAFHHHMQQHPHDPPHHQHADCNDHRKRLHLLDEHHTGDKLKAEIIAHPLFENLLQAHVQCLTVGVSSYDLQATERQLGRRHVIATKYLMQGKNIDEDPPAQCRREIDVFMENYLQLLLLWKKHLEGLVIPPTIDAFSTLCEIEHAFYDLTGVLSNEISNGQMRIDEEWENMCVATELDASDCGIETQSSIDRCLFEHVQTELKFKLKDKYREYIQATREEIVRKRQAGNLPGDTTALKKWWNAHSRWPYPTEHEKKKLAQETGLQMRQISNWFINHRKRNWADRQSPVPPLQLPLSSANAASACKATPPP